MVAVAQSLAVHLSADGSWQVVVFAAHFCGGFLLVCCCHGVFFPWCLEVFWGVKGVRVFPFFYLLNCLNLNSSFSHFCPTDFLPHSAGGINKQVGGGLQPTATFYIP